ncbi:MAG: hypothetical protein R3Y47_07860 [Lachnospiraceae bacterium]
MTHIKNSFSTIVWLLFAAMIATGYTIYMTRNVLQLSSYEMRVIVAVASLIVFSGLLGLITWIIRKHTISISPNEKTVSIIEGVVVIIFLGASIYFHLNENLLMLFASGNTQGLFEVASVSQSQNMMSATPLLLRTYIVLLHALFMLVGNVYEAGIMFQIVLLLVGSICYYGMLRKVTNRVVAVCFLVVALFGYSGFSYASEYNTNMLLYAMSGIVSLVLYHYYISTKKILAHLAWSVIASLLSMCLLMMDLIGLLAVIAFILISIHQVHREKSKRSEVFFVAAFGVASMILMACLLDSILLLLVQEVYLAGINLSLEGLLYLLGQEYILCILIIPVLTYSWNSNKLKMSSLMLMIMLCIVSEAFGVYTDMPYEYILQLLCAVLFMMSLQLYLEPIEQTAKGAVTQDANLQKVEEKPIEIFIPKQMDIPKRVEKPKLDYAEETSTMVMDFDVDVDVSAGYDIE